MTPRTADMSRSAFATWFVVVMLVAAGLRFLFPTADPPWRATVGVVWHDEGAWVHNARNRALFGTWRLDDWNPMFVAPVFTGLEYLSFRAFGVGLWQARLVSEVTGLVSVLLLGLAVCRAGGRRAGLFAAGLLATNYVYVMWNRAALLETTMVAWLVAGFYAYVRSLEEPRWGIGAGLGAWLAFYSKAAAAFFLPALALAAVWSILARRLRGTIPEDASAREARAAYFTLAGLALGAVLGLVLFVAPHWQEYVFYNWQTSVTRKPSYSLRAIADRFSWLPILHDTFTRMWLVLLVAIAVMLGSLVRWRQLAGADRLLVAWIGIGVAELLAHDVGNERRLLILVPAMCAVAALALGRDQRILPRELSGVSTRSALLAAPLVLYAAYLAVGPMGRLPFLYEVRPAVRLSALLAVVAVLALYLTWTKVSWLVTRATFGPAGALTLVAIVMLGDLAQFTQWASGRTYRNYAALKLVGERVPAGTLVHGKLANGLALESRIRPVFVGRGFGNYADRLQRDDIEYVLTYISPRVGYEGPVILDVLKAYPHNRVLWTVPVAETTCACDAVALVAKHATPHTLARPVLSVTAADDTQLPPDREP